MTEPAAPPRTEPVLDNVTRADASDELATTTLLRAAIGPVNTNYYLAIFTRFDAQDKAGPSWNTAAALSTLNWMLLRRMWNPALAYTGSALTVALLVFGIGKLVLHYSSEVQWALAALYALVLVAIPGFWGNALLFRKYRADMALALSAHAQLADACAMLAARAPSRRRLAVLLGLNLMAAAAVVAVTQWAATFNGLPGNLGTARALAPLAEPTAIGNLATGRAVQASIAVAASSAAPALPAATASAAAAPALAQAQAVATPVSAPLAPASAPAVQATSTAYAGRGKVQPALVLPPALQASPASARTPAAPATTASAPQPKATPNPAATTFVINVGLFAEENNARNALVKLKDAGLDAYTQELRGKKGKLTWVRVGPFDALPQAEKTVETIRTLGLDAQVVKLAQ